MKSRTPLYVLVALLIIVLGSIWSLSSFENQEPAQVFPATINRDCAPWDGTAFTVSIPVSDGAIIDISIYHSPDIKLPVTFPFPDETMRDGNALLLLPASLPEELTGKVWFQRVSEGKPVEGRFHFTSERGEQFEGKFIAEWENQAVYCG